MVSFSFFQFRLVTLGDEAFSSWWEFEQNVWLFIFSPKGLWSCHSSMSSLCCVVPLPTKLWSVTGWPTSTTRPPCRSTATSRRLTMAPTGTWAVDYLSGFWSIRRSDPETLSTDISRVSNSGSRQDLTFWLFFVVCQDDEGAHRGRRAVVERKASSDPHRPSFCQRETYSESYRHFSTTEPDTAAERHQTDKQTWWEELWFLLHSVLELMLREVMSFSSLYVFR